MTLTRDASVTGGDLFSYVIKHGRLEEAECKWFGYQLLKGVQVRPSSTISLTVAFSDSGPLHRFGVLQYLHALSIAHRDLKPENVLLKSGGSYPTLLICDFGLATALPGTDAVSGPEKEKGKRKTKDKDEEKGMEPLSVSRSESNATPRRKAQPMAKLVKGAAGGPGVRSASLVGTSSYLP